MKEPPGVTPRPWAVAVDEVGPPEHWYVKDITAADAHVICFGHGYDEYGQMSIADAALVVEAVNAYDRLRAVESAAKAVVATTHDPTPTKDRRWQVAKGQGPSFGVAIQKLRDVLALQEPTPNEQ